MDELTKIGEEMLLAARNEDWERVTTLQEQRELMFTHVDLKNREVVEQMLKIERELVELSSDKLGILREQLVDANTHQRLHDAYKRSE